MLFAGYFGMTMLGMIIHFLKAKVYDNPDLTWSDYWKLSFGKTLLTFFVCIGAIVILNEAGQITLTAALLAGYGGDSALNSWDKKLEGENK